MSKYKIDTEEAQFQPGSNDRVLINKLGVIDPSEMDDIESELLLKLYEKTFLDSSIAESLSFESVVGWHRQWLGNVYEWAGKIRSANIGKGGFQFASASQLESLINNFEKQYLERYQLLADAEREAHVQFLSESHVEFILIHPFREGNGRISRLLMDSIAVEFGYGLLNYTLWDENKEFYFRSIQAGVSGDYQHLARLIRDVLPS